MGIKVLSEKLPLTDECQHYDYLEDVPWDIQKYWHQRYSIFQYYDYDIRMTDDAWFGVTPEPVAREVARELREICSPRKTTLVDLFAGAGGNVIAFALTGQWDRIIAIEKDASTMACAQHNAEVYGVGGVITWIHGDCFEYLAQTKETFTQLDEAARFDPEMTTIFASPPWGGVSYRDQDVFDLSTMQPYGIKQLHSACMPLSHALYLPRTSDIRQIAALVPTGKKIQVAQYCMEGASKAMVAHRHMLRRARRFLLQTTC
ncbi:hypothetical protein GQ53DRAFT_806949 [Thozetella sp. PMI_491]|nr:hypothetical protein GQ53DRAFT_806949 [Thozetella sp. PMI_491]